MYSILKFVAEEADGNLLVFPTLVSVHTQKLASVRGGVAALGAAAALLKVVIQTVGRQLRKEFGLANATGNAAHKLVVSKMKSFQMGAVTKFLWNVARQLIVQNRKVF